MKTKIIVYCGILISLGMISCKKEKPPVFEDYTETRAAIRSHIELTAMIDCAARVMDNVSADTFSYKRTDNDPLTMDTLVSNIGAMNSDARYRVGWYQITYMGLTTDTTCTFNIEFNYKRDNMQVVGNLVLKRSPQSGTERKRVTGAFKLVYADQSSCDVTIDMTNWFSSGVQYYTGKINGNLPESKVFESNITDHPMVSRKCLESTESQSIWLQAGTTILMGGQSEFTTSNQGKGRIWFGPDEADCNNYAVADWLSKKLQFSIDLRDY